MPQTGQELISQLRHSALSSVGFHLIEGLADVLHPGLGRGIHTGRQILSWVRVAGGALAGDGFTLPVEVKSLDLSVEAGLRIGARPGVAPVGIDLGCDPTEMPDPRPQFSWRIAEGVTLKPDEAPGTTARACLIECTQSGGEGRPVASIELAGMSLAAPVGRVIDGAGVFSANTVIAYAQRAAVIKADARRSSLRMKTARRRLAGRRLSMIVYVDPETGFGAVIELHPDWPAVITGMRGAVSA